MKTKHFIKLILTLSAIFFSSTARADYSPAGSKIMLIGDSLAVGLSRRFKILAKEFSYEPVVDAKEGTTILYWEPRLKQKLKAVKPDLLLISLGTNDSGPHGKAFLNDPSKLDNLLKIIQEADVNFVWIGIPPMPRKELPYAIPVSKLIQDKLEINQYYDSTYFGFQRAQDKIHFTANGYSDWMDSIWTWMLDSSLIENINEEDY